MSEKMVDSQRQENQSLQETIYQIADKLRASACLGLHYAQNSYDRERFTGILESSAQLVAAMDGRDSHEVMRQFEENLFHVSPLIGVEAAVVRDKKLLLIQRRATGLWALPGGLTDIGETAADTALRELWEETGLHGHVRQFLGIFDSRLWQSYSKAHLYHMIFQVDVTADEPAPTTEAIDVRFFEMTDFPPLSNGHDRRVPYVVKMLSGEEAVPYFDPPQHASLTFDTHWQHTEAPERP